MEHRQDCWFKDVCKLPSCHGCIRFSEMKYLFDHSNIPINKQLPVKLRPTCDEDVVSFRRLAEIRDNVVDWVNSGNNLYISSKTTGTGKTSWALKIILRFFNNIWNGNGYRVRGMFIHVPTFLSQLKNFDNPLSQEYKDNILNCDLVIWDELASSTITQWEYSQLLIYIDGRTFKNKSNIYTSNITDFKELEKYLGSRLVSRVYYNSEVVEFVGKDVRSIL